MDSSVFSIRLQCLGVDAGILKSAGRGDMIQEILGESAPDLSFPKPQVASRSGDAARATDVRHGSVFATEEELGH